MAAIGTQWQLGVGLGGGCPLLLGGVWGASPRTFLKFEVQMGAC